MKKSLITTLFLFATIITFAQESKQETPSDSESDLPIKSHTFGLKLGYVSSEMVGGYDLSNRGYAYNTSGLSSFMFGAYYKLNPFKNQNWSLRADLDYIQKGGSEDALIHSVDYTTGFDKSYTIGYLQVPVYIGYQIKMPFTDNKYSSITFNCGPYVAAPIFSSFNSNDISWYHTEANNPDTKGEDVSRETKGNSIAGLTLDYGYALNITAQISKRLSLDVTYNIGQTQIADVKFNQINLEIESTGTDGGLLFRSTETNKTFLGNWDSQLKNYKAPRLNSLSFTFHYNICQN